MRAARPPIVRLVALALVVWLAADALSPVTCAHDLIAVAGHSQMADTSSSHQRSSDRDDVNRCSCHWQYLPAASPSDAEFHALAPVVCAPAVLVPPIIERPLDRPPQTVARSVI